MQVWRDGDDCPRPAVGTAVTIGAYDGVHRGHRAVIGRVRALAAERNLESAVVTFDRHPASVVRPASAPKLLTDLDQKLELLEETGVDHALVVHFDEERANETAEAFVAEVLVGCLRVRLVVVGADFHFGHGRKGNVELLARMGSDHGFDVLGLELVGIDGHPADEAQRVSSTGIRSALSAGDLAQANTALGRPYEVRGIVTSGDARARAWGFPTANVDVPDDIVMPADGIYAAWYERPDGSVHAAAASLGRRPTIYDDQRYSLLEAHLLDFDGELYEEGAKVSFVERIRGEERFESINDLVTQIGRDCAEARAILLG
ncbi:MAG: bifunctional riboflavin kinase/FAD synthetase [Acidimicrobiales bacterium]